MDQNESSIPGHDDSSPLDGLLEPPRAEDHTFGDLDKPAWDDSRLETHDTAGNRTDPKVNERSDR